MLQVHGGTLWASSQGSERCEAETGPGKRKERSRTRQQVSVHSAPGTPHIPWPSHILTRPGLPTLLFPLSAHCQSLISIPAPQSFLCTYSASDTLLGSEDTNGLKSRLWFFQWSCMDVRVGL